MPTYQYRCDSCGHEFEEFQSMVDKPLENCPKCEGKVRRIISGGAGFLFKGSGFYITDYRSGQYKKDAAADSTSSSSSSSDSSSSKKSSDSKKSDK
ncbi:MAG: zinc ribbon domain-containing protein [bacterium]|nr:zinc ribbon domain-containing protein [bacterium]